MYTRILIKLDVNLSIALSDKKKLNFLLCKNICFDDMLRSTFPMLIVLSFKDMFMGYNILLSFNKRRNKRAV